MNDLGLIPLIFIVAPGFVADSLYHKIRGASLAEGELRTLLRCLVWSVIGFALASVTGNSLPNLAALMGGNHNLVLNAALGSDILKLTLAALLVAGICGVLPFIRIAREG